MGKKSNSDQPSKTLVVGIGASAGGLEPLKAFFEALPEKTGMAFIVIVHLSPDHESSMAQLLQAHTGLTVMQVKKKTELKEDCVYIIPPSKALAVGDNHLTLSAPENGDHPPQLIDRFFRSLGTVKSHTSAGIILSGTGSDGAVGIKTVKEHGGLTIVQDPGEAQYGGMPQSAIDTGCADKVLPVSRMPEALMNYRKSVFEVRISDDPDGLSGSQEEALANIFGKIKQKTEHDFSHYKRSTMLRRIERRMHVKNAESLADYHSVLDDDPGEAGKLFRDLLISVTNFFRDPEAFQALNEKVIPGLFEDKQPGDDLRVWAPGCATGEEAYSVAMLLAEYAGKLNNPPQIQIFATDVDEQALHMAREGRYPESIAADLTTSRLQRFFSKDGYRYVVGEKLRDMILFSKHDLLRRPPFSNMDLISCRNLLIYLNKKLQGEVFNLFHYALKQEGKLFLGSSGSNLKAAQLFKEVDPKHRIYRKKSGTHAKSRLPDFPLQFSKDKIFDSHSWKMPSKTKIGFERLHQRIMTRRHAPPSVIINESEEVLHASGDIGRFVNYRRGEPSRNILEMVRPDLRQPLRSILYRVKKEETKLPARTQVQAVMSDELQLIEVLVEPLQEKDFPDDLMLVVFKKISDLKPAGGEELPNKEDMSREEAKINEELENELKQTKQRLQITVEDYETANEELRSSNEELQSMNEELQSTTEELETSQEELRSANEELKMVNQKLKSKVDALQRANSDLKNLMEATEIAIIFVDRDLRLKRFTSKATDLFNLAPSDMGRPLEHFTHRLAYDGIMGDIKHTLDHLDKTQQQVADEDGNTYILRLRPYHTTDGNIEGVVVTLVDVTELKAVREALAEKIERIKTLQRQIITADVHERWEVGKYLHDEVAQSLVVAKISLEGIRAELGKGNDEWAGEIEKVSEIITQSLTDVRNLSHDILPVDLEKEGMEHAFNTLADQMEEVFNLNCVVEVGSVIKTMDDIETATNLYRIAQEATKNAALHGEAEQVKITLRSDDHYLHMDIEDDGRGFAATEESGGGMGIPIMRHRMELMGGMLEIAESSHFEGTGAHVSCKMPLDGQP